MMKALRGPRQTPNRKQGDSVVTLVGCERFDGKKHICIERAWNTWRWTDLSRFSAHLLKLIESKSNINSLPTVQQVCIPTAMLNVDVLCQAKSGLGKTAVFVLTTLHQLEAVPGECQVLVMCHTRELAYQIKNEYARFSKYLPDVKTAVFYGGTPMVKDVETLSNKDTYPNIIVATPGRLNALVRDKKLSLRNIKAFVLDECDKMLDQIGSYIIAILPFHR